MESCIRPVCKARLTAMREDPWGAAREAPAATPAERREVPMAAPQAKEDRRPSHRLAQRADRQAADRHRDHRLPVVERHRAVPPVGQQVPHHRAVAMHRRLPRHRRQHKVRHPRHRQVPAAPVHPMAAANATPFSVSITAVSKQSAPMTYNSVSLVPRSHTAPTDLRSPSAWR